MIKKLLKIGLGIFILLVVGIVAVPFFVDVNHLKEPIQKKIEEKIDGKVEIGKIALRIFPSPGLSVKDVLITNNTGPFAGQTAAKFGAMNIRVDFRSLLSRKIVGTLIFVDPEIFYKSTENGVSNLESLNKNSTQKFEMTRWMKRIEVESVEIQNGKLIPFINHLNLEVSHILLDHLNQPIQLKADMSILGASSNNLKLEGKVAFKADEKIIGLDDFKIFVGSTPMALKGQLEYGPEVPRFQITLMSSSLGLKTFETLNPALIASLPKGTVFDGEASMNLTANGSSERATVTLNLNLEKARLAYGDYFKKGEKVPSKILLSYSGSLKDILGKGSTSEGTADIDSFFILNYQPTHFHSKISYVNQILNFEDMAFQIFDGKVLGKGSVNLHTEKPEWNFNLKMSDVDMDSLLSTVGGYKDVLKGRGGLTISLKGTGSETSEIKKTASGNGSVTLANGKLNGVNLAREVLGSSVVDVINVAGAGLVVAGVSPSRITSPRFALQGQETTFSSFQSSFTIENGFVSLPELKILQPSSTTNLGGRVSLDGDLDLKGNFLLTREETNQWLGDFSGKRFLVDSEGRFLLPFTMTGNPTAPKVLPDTGYVTTKLQGAAASLAKEKAGELLQKNAEPLQKNLEKPLDALKKLFQ